jgi:hypothetical protein
MFSCKLSDLSHATLLPFTCVCSATLLISSWGGVGGGLGWDVNVHRHFHTCHMLCYAAMPIHSLVSSGKRVEAAPETIHSTQLSQMSWLQRTSDRTSRSEEIGSTVHVAKLLGPCKPSTFLAQLCKATKQVR